VPERPPVTGLKDEHDAEILEILHQQHTPFWVKSDEKNLELLTQALQKADIYKFQLGERSVFSYYNTPLTYLATSPTDRVPDTVFLTTRRILKVERDEVVCDFRYSEIRSVTYLHKGPGRYDKLLFTFLDGKIDTLGVWGSSECAFFVQCIQAILTHSQHKGQVIPQGIDDKLHDAIFLHQSTVPIWHRQLYSAFLIGSILLLFFDPAFHPFFLFALCLFEVYSQWRVYDLETVALMRIRESMKTEVYMLA